MVDDQSTDNTRDIIKDIVKEYPQCRYIFHEKNTGRGGAVTTGINNAKAEIVGYIDVDIEVSPVYIPYCVERVREGHDVVIGMRIYKVKLSGAFRYLTHWIYLQMVKTKIGINYLNDTETGYKFFKKSTILPVLEKCRDTHWFWSTELVAWSHLSGLTFFQVPVLYLRNEKKKTTVKVMWDSIRYYKSLIAFAKRERKSIKRRGKEPAAQNS
jgi:glycosyltransferase involved in cell wall biosynthesis